MHSFTGIASKLSRKRAGHAFIMAFAFSAFSMQTQAQNTSSPATQTGALTVDHVVNVIGTSDLKSNVSGNLVFDESKMSFVASDSTAEVPLKLIKAFSISRDNVPLIGGVKGTVASFAPYGVGQLTSVIRPNSDTLTLVYFDQHQAVHGSILILPKGKGDDVSEVLANVGLASRDYPQASPVPIEEIDTMALKQEILRAQGRRSIRVALLTESADGIPAAFPVGAYEDLISQLTSSGLFENVWRQGDDRAGADTLTLHVNIRKFKKGSPRARALVPFTGATVIKVNVQLTDSTRNVLFNKDINAAKRIRGESMTVTKGLAKKVKEELTKLPDLQPVATNTTN